MRRERECFPERERDYERGERAYESGERMIKKL